MIGKSTLVGILINKSTIQVFSKYFLANQPSGALNLLPRF
jgi:hypothetical protein